MKTLSIAIALLCLLAASLSGQPANQPLLQDQLETWLNSQTPRQSRLDTFIALIRRTELQGAMLERYAVNPKAVSDALVFTFGHGDAGHQGLALQWAVGVQDRASYSRMIEPALHSPNPEVRSIAMGAAGFFKDKSEVVVLGLLAELRSTNSPSNLDTACAVAAMLQLQEAIEPMADLVANSSLGRARGVAESLAGYPSLPASVITRLEAARTRFEREQAEADKRPKTPTQEWLEKQRKDNSTPSEFELLFKALALANEKALLPPPARIEQAKDSTTAKQPKIGTVEGKTSPAIVPATQTASPVSTPNSGTAGRNGLLLLLALASVAVIAWILLRGGGR